MRRTLLLICLCLSFFGYAQDRQVMLYHGTESIALDALPQGTPPYVKLRDFLRGLGLNAGFENGPVIQLEINRRQLILDKQEKVADLGWRKFPISIREQGGEPYIRADLLADCFTELLGRTLIYEPTTVTLHIARSEDLKVEVRLRQLDGYERLSLAYSKAIEAPRVALAGSRLSVHLNTKHLVVSAAGFKPTELVTEIYSFIGLPDGTSEIQFTLAPGVKHSVEPYLPENPITAIQLRGPNADADPQTTEVGKYSKQDLKVIVIDPGHGGKDEGARGGSGLKEKDVTLEICKRLKEKLEGDYEVYLTRNDDYSLNLKTRTGIANNYKADLFISVHVNAIRRPDAWGSETFYLALEGELGEDDHYLVDFENREELDDSIDQEASGAELDLELMLWDLAQTEHLEDSFRLAKYTQEELNILAGIRNRGVKQAPLKVLRGAMMPAVLIEVAFISNPQEEQKLKNPYFKDRIAESIVKAVKRYHSEVIRRSRGSQNPSQPTREGK